MADFVLFACRLVSQLRPFAGMQHLDVAGGTGDIAFRVLQKIREAEAEAQCGASAPDQVNMCPAAFPHGERNEMLHQLVLDCTMSVS